jgi:predicted AlkP superfamily phosphohydrolase/phosphomutase
MFSRFKTKTPAPKVAVIGLDCAEPSLMFEQFAADLPVLSALRTRGTWGRLTSVIPAITVPAWSCMMSGRDPGALGIYGFRNRAAYAYHDMITADSRAVQVPRLWDELSQRGKRSIVLNVPGTYPVKPLNGEMISCFLTPNARANYTYPDALKSEIERWIGAYPFDAKAYRTEQKAELLPQITEMTKTHFDVARRLASRGQWDFFMMVEIGLDRMHHAFWRFMDSQHHRYTPNSPFQHAIRDYYRLLDHEIGRLITAFDRDTHILIVSDHGAQRMEGGICINEWLIQNGYLTLKSPYPTGTPMRLDQLEIDWSRTAAWGDGGYYGRLFLNIEGREPHGIVQPEAVDRVLNEIREKLQALGDEQGLPIHTRCLRPQEVYAQVNGIPPDLMIYFGDLAWRSIGTIGWNRVHVRDNDTGPDDANHAQDGLYIHVSPNGDSRGRYDRHILEIKPLIEHCFS